MRRQKVVASKNDHNIDDDARLRNDTISRGNISRSRVMCGPWSIRLQHEVTILKCKSSRQQIHFNSRTNTAALRTNASYLEDKSKLSWEQMREMRRRNPVGPFLSHQLCQAGPPHAFTLPSLLVVTILLYLCWPQKSDFNQVWSIEKVVLNEDYEETIGKLYCVHCRGYNCFLSSRMMERLVVFSR